MTTTMKREKTPKTPKAGAKKKSSVARRKPGEEKKRPIVKSEEEKYNENGPPFKTTLVLDLRTQVPEIIEALKRGEEVLVMYDDQKSAWIEPAFKLMEKRRDARDEPAFGMWKDREDMADPAAWLRNLRKGRYRDL